MKNATKVKYFNDEKERLNYFVLTTFFNQRNKIKGGQIRQLFYYKNEKHFGCLLTSYKKLLQATKNRLILLNYTSLIKNKIDCTFEEWFDTVVKSLLLKIKE